MVSLHSIKAGGTDSAGAIIVSGSSILADGAGSVNGESPRTASRRQLSSVEAVDGVARGGQASDEAVDRKLKIARSNVSDGASQRRVEGTGSDCIFKRRRNKKST